MQEKEETSLSLVDSPLAGGLSSLGLLSSSQSSMSCSVSMLASNKRLTVYLTAKNGSSEMHEEEETN